MAGRRMKDERNVNLVVHFTTVIDRETKMEQNRDIEKINSDRR